MPAPTVVPPSFMSVADIKQQLGLPAAPDPALDQRLDRISKALTAHIRGYCGRQLSYWFHRETFYRNDQPSLWLREWPVESVFNIELDGTAIDVSPILVHHEAGRVRLDCSAWHRREIAVDYVSGYEPIPADLVEVFLAAIEARHADGAGSGLGGGTGTGGQISRMTIVDTMSIAYDTSGDGDTTSASKAAALGELAPWANVLDRYRTHFAMLAA